MQDIQLNLKFDKQYKCILCSLRTSPLLFFKRGNAPTIIYITFLFCFSKYVFISHSQKSYRVQFSFIYQISVEFPLWIRQCVKKYTPLTLLPINIKSLFTTFLLCCLVTKSCCLFWDPVGCSPPGSSVRGISQARILEWFAISFSRGSS